MTPKHFYHSPGVGNSIIKEFIDKCVDSFDENVYYDKAELGCDWSKEEALKFIRFSQLELAMMIIEKVREVKRVYEGANSSYEAEFWEKQRDALLKELEEVNHGLS